MPNPVAAAVRAAIESGVELAAAFNRRRLPAGNDSFLTGIHAPMTAEVTLRDLAVTGSVPAGCCVSLTF